MGAVLPLRTRAPDSRPLPPAEEGTVADLVARLAEARALVLTGAGCSTGSGIPDYRDDRGRWKGRAPMQYQAFVGSAANRRRYWARSLVGWARVAAARPNDAHRAVAALAVAGRLSGVVTQNVDGLHQRSGATGVVDLHGRLDRVECLDCGAVIDRHAFQETLLHDNPDWAGIAASHAPDGDADLDDVDYDAFRVPACRRCGGVLKPGVVFFGEGVPGERVTLAMAALERAGLLLVAGSSLMVWSGYRFVRAAVDRGIPVVAVGRGVTRAEGELAFRVTGDCAEVLPALAAGVGAWRG
ncbi:NAD-dependent protein deacetylase [wastewater metagenome]|uniref:NAD-dependent protein deacetylase n=3 Tax=root TaxID=1 RepID=A0A5B8RE76_9ZZZZ|nr:NAD-dependent protein deacetylase [Arhodomonas aquaeolei]QEA05105.1 NAD-dependent protein deacetylase [uncultured organism]